MNIIKCDKCGVEKRARSVKDLYMWEEISEYGHPDWVLCSSCRGKLNDLIAKWLEEHKK